jgi:hypothetical protein
MMRCRAGGGPPRGGAYQTALQIVSAKNGPKVNGFGFIGFSIFM